MGARARYALLHSPNHSIEQHAELKKDSLLKGNRGNWKGTNDFFFLSSIQNVSYVHIHIYFFVDLTKYLAEGKILLKRKIKVCKTEYLFRE
jgi:hypothetical protein